MPRARVKLNHAGIAALLKSDDVRAHLHELGEGIKTNGEGRSPIGDPEGGHYRDNFVIEDDTTDRAVVRVGNTSPYALKVESAHQVLGGSF